MSIDSEILELFSGLERKVDFERWPDYVFFFRGEACLFRYNLNSGSLWCERNEVWNKIKESKGFDYAQTQTFIKKLVEQHFKMRGIRPLEQSWPRNFWVEDLFKMRNRES